LSLSFIIVLEKEIPGVEPRGFEGRRIAAERHALDSIAHEHDLRGLGEFVSFSLAEAEALAEDMKFEAPTAGASTGRWFRASSGLEVVRALLTHLGEHRDAIDDAAEILASLETMESILRSADELGVRFRLSLEY
jgi:hypothetical protein